jgi:hypothetical protein
MIGIGWQALQLILAVSYLEIYKPANISPVYNCVQHLINYSINSTFHHSLFYYYLLQLFYQIQLYSE